MSIKINISFEFENLYNMVDFDKKDGSWDEVFALWGRMYRSEMQERFDKFSKGGGDWPQLAQSTINARRHGKGGRHKRGKKAYLRAKRTGGGQVSILRDTGLLFNALDPQIGRPGQLQEILTNGVRVGFDSTGNYDRSSLTIADIASFHQKGSARLPQRKILVGPSKDTIRKMQQSLIKLCAKKGNGG